MDDTFYTGEHRYLSLTCHEWHLVLLYTRTCLYANLSQQVCEPVAKVYTWQFCKLYNVACDHEASWLNRKVLLYTDLRGAYFDTLNISSPWTTSTQQPHLLQLSPSMPHSLSYTCLWREIIDIMYIVHVNLMYSGAPLIRTPLGPEQVDGLTRCPYFRG